MTARLTLGQRNALAEAARSAAEDVAAYRAARGTPTWDHHRVGRMLARDPVVAELVPLALAELAAVTVERDQLREQLAAARCARDFIIESMTARALRLIDELERLTASHDLAVDTVEALRSEVQSLLSQRGDAGREARCAPDASTRLAGRVGKAPREVDEEDRTP